MSLARECNDAFARLLKAADVENKPGERAFWIGDALVRLDGVLQELAIRRGVPTQAIADFVQSWSVSVDAACKTTRAPDVGPSA